VLCVCACVLCVRTQILANDSASSPPAAAMDIFFLPRARAATGLFWIFIAQAACRSVRNDSCANARVCVCGEVCVCVYCEQHLRVYSPLLSLHTHTYTYMNTNTHTHMHRYIHTHTHTHVCTPTHPHSWPLMLSRTMTRISTPKYTHAHTHSTLRLSCPTVAIMYVLLLPPNDCANNSVNLDSRYLYTHVHTHTHTHIYIYIYICIHTRRTEWCDLGWQACE